MDARYDPRWPHPFKQVPYLLDGDLMLSESRAMSKYLLARNGLYPTDPVKVRFCSSLPFARIPIADFLLSSSLLLLVVNMPARIKIALFEQACSVEASNFDVAGVGIAVEKVVKKCVLFLPFFFILSCFFASKVDEGLNRSSFLHILSFPLGRNKGLEPDERLVAAYVDTFTRRMPGYESILSKSEVRHAPPPLPVPSPQL